MHAQAGSSSLACAPVGKILKLDVSLAGSSIAWSADQWHMHYLQLLTEHHACAGRKHEPGVRPHRRPAPGGDHLIGPSSCWHLRLVNSKASNCSCSPSTMHAQAESISLECAPIGDLLKVEIGLAGPSTSWHLHLVTVTPEDAAPVHFPAMRWLDALRGDGLTILSLLVSTTGSACQAHESDASKLLESAPGHRHARRRSACALPSHALAGCAAWRRPDHPFPAGEHNRLCLPSS